jgi:CRISPR-associated endonuclease Cas1 subtype II
MSYQTVVISRSAKLDYSMGYLVVRQEGTKKIHMADISVLMIESTAVSLTAALLAELTKSKVKVVFCDEKRQPSSELLPYYGCHDCSGKLRTQIGWADNIKNAVWTEIVREKISKQSEHLKEYGLPSAVLLEDYICDLSFGDESNREGHAARVYFSALFGDNFSRSQENSINAALNYGYSILLSMFDREIVLNGYTTRLGIFHDNADNPFNLGSDLMEPFRILVDRIVRRNIPEKFEAEEKRRILEIVNGEVSIAGKKEYIPNAVKIYVRSVFDAINDNDISEINFYQVL